MEDIGIIYVVYSYVVKRGPRGMRNRVVNRVKATFECRRGVLNDGNANEILPSKSGESISLPGKL